MAILATTTALAHGASSAIAANIAVIDGSEQDGLFNLITNGVDDATLVVKANGGTVNDLRTQNYDNSGADLVGLINIAISQGVQSIAIPIWVPDAEAPALRQKAAR